MNHERLCLSGLRESKSLSQPTLRGSLLLTRPPFFFTVPKKGNSHWRLFLRQRPPCEGERDRARAGSGGYDVVPHNHAGVLRNFGDVARIRGASTNGTTDDTKTTAHLRASCYTDVAPR